MRPLISKEIQDKKRKRNQITVGVILVGLMLVSTLGYAFQSGFGQSNASNSNEEKVTVNGIDFFYRNGLWAAGSMAFRYNPEQIEVKPLVSTLNDGNAYSQKVLYLTSSDADAGNEVSSNMGLFVERVQEACYPGQKCLGGLPVKGCDENFVIIREAATSSIRQDNKCVYIEGKKEDLVQMADLFLFKVLGIK